MELIEKIQNRTHLAKLVSKKEIASDTHELVFELEYKMDYRPGQYVWVEIPHLIVPDIHGNRRAFSITSIPDATNSITIVFRSSPSGYNQSLRSAVAGDEFNVIGPFGDAFCFPDDPEVPLILIGGGVGVAPFLSLVRYAAREKIHRNISLFVLNKSDDRLFYGEELRNYNDSPSIKTKTLSKTFEYGDIEDFVGLGHALVYVSGPQGFVDLVHTTLKTRGVFEYQFHFEHIYPSTSIDVELIQLFSEGKPKIEPSESLLSRQHMMLTYELVNATATHTVVTDIRGRIVFANKAAQDITGYTLEEMLGNTPRLWGGLMPKEFYKTLWETKLRGEIFSGEIVNRRKNGEIYIAAAHISPIKNENQEVVGFIGSEEDITEVRKSEQKANENEERFVQLTEKIPEVYWIIEFDPKEKVVYASPAFEQVWGVPRSALYENWHVWIDHIHPEDRQKVMDTFKLFLGGKSAFSLDFRVLQPGGKTLIVHAQADKALDEHKHIMRVVGVARDITKEKTIDQEKSEFVSFASHQLKTPITATRWNIETLLAGKYGQLSPKQLEVMRGILTMNTRIDELISNLLNISRIEQGVFLIDPAPIDFTKVCDEVLLEMGPYVEKRGHTLTKNFQGNLPQVSADAKLLRIVFQNFISNAIKYTHEHGKITVSLKVEGSDIVFSVANDGAPIPEADQEKIFGKMFRASNAPEQDPGGTGLGLYIVKQILENAGGRVGFSSKPGQDTIFFATVPLSGMIRKEGTKSLSN